MANRARLNWPAPAKGGEEVDRIPVSSTNLRSVGYDARGLLLEVEFLDGAVYQYFSVPLAVYQELMAAGSKGSFLAKHVRNQYQYRRIL